MPGLDASMLKIILAVLVVWILWRAIKAFQAGAARPHPRPEPKTHDMVRCARCGVYLPADKALTLPGIPKRHFCPEHAPRQE